MARLILWAFSTVFNFKWLQFFPHLPVMLRGSLQNFDINK